MSKSLLLLSLSLFFLLTACTAQSRGDGSTPAASRTPAASPKTATATTTAKPVPTATLPATTVSPAPTATPRLIPTNSPTAISTPEATPAVYTWLVHLDDVSAPYLSPDGQWEMVVLESSLPAGRHVEFWLRRTDGRGQWLIESFDADPFGKWPVPFLWLGENELWYSHRSGGDACDAGVEKNTDLWRVDLSTRESTQILPRLGYWLALAPDMTRLAYIDDSYRLGWRDLDSGQHGDVSLTDQGGYASDTLFKTNAIWSPDGQRIAVAMGPAGCVYPEAWFSVIVVNPVSGQQSVVIEQDSSMPRPVAWTEANHIILENNRRERLSLDLENLSAVTISVPDLPEPTPPAADLNYTGRYRLTREVGGCDLAVIHEPRPESYSDTIFLELWCDRGPPSFNQGYVSGLIRFGIRASVEAAERVMLAEHAQCQRPN